MVGGLEAGRRLAAAALLALGSVVPHNSTLLAARGQIAPVADSGIACPLTVGTATTDPALANDAARAIAVGYAITDCMPDAQLLAAAEARALIPMGAPTATVPMASAGSGIIGASSGTGIAGTSSGEAAAAMPNGAVSLPAVASPTTAPTTTTSDSTTLSATTSDSTTTSRTGTLADNEGSSTGSSSDDSESRLPESDTDNQVDPGTNSGVTNPPTTGGSITHLPATGDTVTAADTFNWGTAAAVEDFDGTLSNWGVDDGPGHAGNGRRSPSAVSVSGGILTISGDTNGTTGGLAWRLGSAKYGRWEARAKSPVADPAYNAVMLLWPDADNGPVGGEVDVMEISDQSRQKADFFLHYGEADHQLHGEKVIDATQWHNWAVEWTPTTITGYVDGVAWFSTSRADALPPGPMHLALQLDWFPGSGSGAARQSEMQVDWVRYYPVDGPGSATATATADPTTAPTASVAVTATSTATSSTTTGPTKSG
jgi:hypothetical protein